MANKYTRLLKNTGIVFVGNAGSKLLLFLMLPFYTRYLGPAEYGVSDLIVTYATMLLGLVTCQIQDAVFVFPKGETYSRQQQHFSSGLVFLLGSYIVCGLGIFVVSGFFSRGAFFRQYSGLIVSVLFLNGLHQYLQQFCRAVDRMVIYALSGLGLTLIVVLLSIWLIPVYPTGRVLGLIQCAGFAGGIVISLLGARLWHYFRHGAFSRASLVNLLKYAIPLVPTAVMWWALTGLNRPFLERYCSLAAVGFYAAAIKLPSILGVGWSVIGNAWQISVLEEYREPGFVRYFWSFFGILACGVIAVVLVLTVGSTFFMRFLVGPEYYSVSKFIPLLSLGAGFSVLAGSIGALYAASRKSKYFFYSSLWAVGSVIAFNAVLIPRFGLWGAAWANMLSMAVELVVRLCYGLKLLKEVAR